LLPIVLLFAVIASFRSFTHAKKPEDKSTGYSGHVSANIGCDPFTWLRRR